MQATKKEILMEMYTLLNRPKAALTFGDVLACWAIVNEISAYVTSIDIGEAATSPELPVV